MFRLRATAVLLLVWTLGVWGVVPAAMADDAPKLTVYIMEASNQPGGVDPELRDIYKRMGGAFGYTTLRLISKQTHAVPVGTEKTLSVPGDRMMVLNPTGIHDDRLDVNVRITQSGEQPMRVTGQIVRGGTFIIGGYKYGPGRLVFAISADF